MWKTKLWAGILFAVFLIITKIWKQPKIVNNEGLAWLPITAQTYNSMHAISKSTKLFELTDFWKFAAGSWVTKVWPGLNEKRLFVFPAIIYLCVSIQVFLCSAIAFGSRLLHCRCCIIIIFTWSYLSSNPNNYGFWNIWPQGFHRLCLWCNPMTSLKFMLTWNMVGYFG